MERLTNTADDRITAKWRRTDLLAFCFLVFTLWSAGCSSSVQEKPERESPFKPLAEDAVSTDAMEGVDFSKFSHSAERHSTVPCLMCHQRTEGETKPKFPSHATCTGCHAPQLMDNSHPICTTCHTEVNSEELKSFPPMRSFRANFNHTEHFKQSDCATCHKTQGTGMTVPAGANAHSTCFQCHTNDKVVGERNIGSCATCHEAGPANRITDSTAAIGFNFDHSSHSSQNCTSCHSPTGGGNKMSAVTVAMHGGRANSCATCHNEQKAFGANDFSDCKKCHQEVAGVRSFGIRFDHAKHTKQNCATCHKAGGNGVSFAVPNSEAAHKTCFECHSPTKDTGNFKTSMCFQCHQPGNGNNLLPPRGFVAGNFSHTKHGFFECDSCHTTSKGVMNVPAVQMHKAPKSGTNCATCHNNDIAFGENFANCKSCHTGGKFKPK